MRSKTSFFNPTLFRKNLTRFWPLWGGASALGALAPLAVLAALLDEGLRSHTGEALEITLGYYHILAYLVPIISLFYAALCALAVWHYLYNARSVGLYHSLPITRKGLFVTNFLSGMAMMLIPYVVVGGLAVLISLAAGLFDPVGVLMTILGVIGESFFYFAAASLVVFITGNPFAFAAFYFIFHFIAAGAEWLLSELMTQFYFGVEQAYEGVIEFLSPTIYLFRNLDPYASYVQIPTPDGWIERGDIEFVTLNNGWLIAVYALVGAVLLGCAWLLYQRRRSESAGDVVAVGWMKPIFRYGVALCAALAGGVMLYFIFHDTFQRGSTAEAVPMAICMAIAGVVGYYIASMLLAKSLKVFRGSGKGALVTVIAAVAICFFIAADPFGVESWTPAAGEVENVTLTIYGTYGRALSAQTDDPAVLQKVLDLHQAIFEEADTLDRWTSETDWGQRSQIYLSYQLPGVKWVYRYYTLPFTEASLAQSKAVQLAVSAASDPVLQEESIFSQITGSNLSDVRLISASVSHLYNTQTQEYENQDLPAEQAKILEAAVRRDIQAGHFGKTLLVSSYEEYAQAACSFNIYFTYSSTWHRDNNKTETYTPTVNLSISTHCTETIKALEQLGLVDATHKILTEEQSDALRQMHPGGSSYYDGDIYYPESTEVFW